MRSLLIILTFAISLASCDTSDTINTFVMDYTYSSANGTAYHHIYHIQSTSEDAAIAEALEMLSEVDHYANMHMILRYAKTYNDPKGRVIFSIN